MISAGLIIFWGSMFAYADACGPREFIGSGPLDAPVLATSIEGRGMPEILLATTEGLRLLAPGFSIPLTGRGGKFRNDKNQVALGGDHFFWATAAGVMGCAVSQCSTEALVLPSTDHVVDMLASGKNVFVLTERKGSFVLSYFSIAQKTSKELVTLGSTGAIPALNRSGRAGSVILTSLLPGTPPTWRSTIYPEGTDLVALPRLDQGPWNYGGVNFIQGLVLVTYVAVGPGTRTLYKTKVAGGGWELELDPRTDGAPLFSEVMGSNEEKALVTLATLSRGPRGTVAKFSNLQIQTGALVSQWSHLVLGSLEGVEGKYLLHSEPNDVAQTRNFFGTPCSGP